MLMKRIRSIQEDQNMAASETHHNHPQPFSYNKHINNSVYTFAGLLLSQGPPKALSDCDLVMSPTSPLDLMNIPNPFIARKILGPCGKVGLSLVNSLDNSSPLAVEGSKNQYNPASDGKNIVLRPQLRVKTPSFGLQYDDQPVISRNKIKSLGTSIFEIADASEPKRGKEFRSYSLRASSHFLSFCYSCSKDLAGEDIYIYRGEKAFCSPSCREMEVLDDEKLEESENTNPDRHDLEDQETE